MKKDKIVQLLECLGTDIAKEQNRTGWLLAHCPLGPWKHAGEDKHPSFGVKLGEGDNRCNCFSCGHSSTLSDLVTTVAVLNRKHPHEGMELGKAREIAETASDELVFDMPDTDEILFGHKEEKFQEFPAWWLDTFKPVAQVPFAREYLKSRNVPEQFWEEYDLRADTGQLRVCIPVRDYAGRLAGLHGRDVTNESPMRYRMYTYKHHSNPDVWLGENWVTPEFPVIFVEGYFDLLSVARVYRNVVSPLFVNPSFEKLNRMGDCLEIFTFYDHGKGGDAGRAKVSKWAGKRVVRHLLPPNNRKDPGVCTVDELVEIFEDLVPLAKKIVA